MSGFSKRISPVPGAVIGIGAGLVSRTFYAAGAALRSGLFLVLRPLFAVVDRYFGRTWRRLGELPDMEVGKMPSDYLTRLFGGFEETELNEDVGDDQR